MLLYEAAHEEGREGGREGRGNGGRGKDQVRRRWWGETERAYQDAVAFALPFPVVLGHEDETGDQVLRVARPAAELASLHGESQSSSLPFLFPPSVPPSLLSLPSRALIPSSAFSFVVLEAMVWRASATVFEKRFFLTQTPSLPPSLPLSLPTAERALPACPPPFLRHRQEPQPAAAAWVPALPCVVV